MLQPVSQHGTCSGRQAAAHMCEPDPAFPQPALGTPSSSTCRQSNLLARCGRSHLQENRIKNVAHHLGLPRHKAWRALQWRHLLRLEDGLHETGARAKAWEEAGAGQCMLLSFEQVGPHKAAPMPLSPRCWFSTASNRWHSCAWGAS